MVFAIEVEKFEVGSLVVEDCKIMTQGQHIMDIYLGTKD